MFNAHKDFIDLEDFTKAELQKFLKTAARIKKKFKTQKSFKPLKDKTLAMLFSKSSTRTRVSFEAGMTQLGGRAMFLSSHDIQLGRGEPISDTGKVLSRYIDAIMIRTFDHNDVINLARNSSVPVINGLTDYNHPCQIMADLMTIEEEFQTLKDIPITWIGDANNVAVSLVKAALVLGLKLRVASPEGYRFDKHFQEKAQKGGVQFFHTPQEAAEGSFVIYTDVWTSMGQEEENAKRLRDFKDWQINREIMALADKNAVFLHCLPAHRGEEVTAEVIDGSRSLVFQQAENRLHAQKGILYTLLK